MTKLICAGYRKTRYGGLDKPVGYKLKVDNNEVKLVAVGPATKEYSKTYMHGKYCWREEDIDIVIIYGMSNSGKCYVEMPYAAQLNEEEREEIKKIVKTLWCIKQEIPETITISEVET